MAAGCIACSGCSWKTAALPGEIQLARSVCLPMALEAAELGTPGPSSAATRWRQERPSWGSAFLGWVTRHGSAKLLFGAQWQHQCQRMLRRWTKPVMFIELPGSVMQCMDEQGADSCILRNKQRAIDRVSQQGRAELDALDTLVHGQPCQHDDRDRIGHVATHAAGGPLV